MPGMCGVIGWDRDSSSPPLAAMVEPLMPHPWFVVERCEEIPELRAAAVSLDRSGRKSRVVISDDSSLACVLDGEFYNSSELARDISAGDDRARLSVRPSDAELLLTGWRSKGANFARRISGSFSAVIWDARQRVATLLTDRFGNRPLYYTVLGERLLFGSSIKCLTADSGVNLEVDPRGLAQFFTFGHYLNCNTSLASVKVLPAAACWTWSAETSAFRQECFHSWSEAYSEPPLVAGEWIDQISDTFGRAVEDQARDTPNLGLSLSGGLDARSILAAIDVKQTPLKTVCLGISGSLDHRCAQQLANLAGCDNHSHVLDTQFLSDYRRHLEEMVRLTDGQYLSQCIVMPTLPLYRKLGIEVLLRGHAGELMHMYKAYNYSLDEESLAIRGNDHLEEWLFKRLSAYMLKGVEKPVFRSDLWQNLESLARESLVNDIESTASVAPPAQRIWQLFLTQRLRRETVLSLNKFRSVAETRLPFLDNRLIPLLLAAPPNLKLGETIQAGLLKRFRPEFLQVMNANTGTKVGAGSLRRKFSSLKLRALGKLGLPGYQPYERLGLWLKRELRQVVQEILLAPETLDRGIYDPDGLRSVVASHQAGRQNHTYLIMALMIFELGQRYLELKRAPSVVIAGK